MENYFNYFTEIEEHFQRRRGAGLLLSTLDWALIETWKDAEIPLEAVLRGIDAAFDHYEQRPRKTRKVNSLAYCAQEVLAAAEDVREAAVGASQRTSNSSGFDPAEIANFLRHNAKQLETATLPERSGVCPERLAHETAGTLRELARDLEDRRAIENKAPGLRLEDLERRLAALEERLLAALLAATSDEEIVSVRTEADRDLAPYRSKMPVAQIEQLQKQYVYKRLLEHYRLPRLSLFYM